MPARGVTANTGDLLTSNKAGVMYGENCISRPGVNKTVLQHRSRRNHSCGVIFFLALIFCCLLQVNTAKADPPCTISAESSVRFHVLNNCDKSVVLLFSAGITGSIAAGQWCDAFGTYYQYGAGAANPIDFYYTYIAPGVTKDFPIPYAGAASGNIIFAYDCTTTSNGFSDCKIVRDTTEGHTIAEISAGCAYGTGDARCAQNPSNTSLKLDATDYYDVSAVNGYTLPMTFELTNPGSGITAPRTDVDGSMLDLGSCATEYGYGGDGWQTLYMTTEDKTQYPLTYALLQNADYKTGISLAAQATPSGGGDSYYTSCASPSRWFSNTTLGTPPNPSSIGGKTVAPPNTFDWYGSSNLCGQTECTDTQTTPCTCTCPQCRGAQTSKGMFGNYKNGAIQYTNFVKTLKESGYSGYTWAYDDGAGTATAAWTGDQTSGVLPQYTVTVCPNGGDPVSKGQKWAYDSVSGKCEANSSGAYASYHACLTQDPTAKTKFTLVSDEILGFPNAGIPNRTFQYCIWNGEATTGLMNYEDCVAKAYPTGSPGAPAPTDLLLLE